MNWILLVFIFLLGTGFFIYPLAALQEIVLFGNLAKVFSLFVAASSLTSTQNVFKTGDTPQKAWTSLAAGMWIWFFAQVIFAFYKIVLKQSPYPSLADIFFVIAYFPLLVGVALLIKDFRSTGLPMGSKNSYLLQAASLIAFYAIIFFWKLKDLLMTNDAPFLKFLNVGYPTFDFLLIAMTSVLIRISLVLRGGSLARSWIVLGLGFTLVGIADIIFAYQPLPFLDMLFFSGYFLIGLAGIYQLRMLRQ